MALWVCSRCPSSVNVISSRSFSKITLPVVRFATIDLPGSSGLHRRPVLLDHYLEECHICDHKTDRLACSWVWLAFNNVIHCQLLANGRSPNQMIGLSRLAGNVAISPPFQRNGGTKWLRHAYRQRSPDRSFGRGFFHLVGAPLGSIPPMPLDWRQ